MKFLRHILIKSQKHFQENIIPSQICLNLSDFFPKFVWNLVPENIEKSIWVQKMGGVDNLGTKKSIDL